MDKYGAKNRGEGQPKELEKTNGIVGLKTRGGIHTKKKENMNGLVGAKNRGLGRPFKEKRENKWISWG